MKTNEPTQSVRRRARLRALSLALLLLLFPIVQAAALDADALVPIGRTAGIKIYADGVIVTDFSQLHTANGYESPAQAAGLKAGDVITHCNGTPTPSADALSAALRTAETAELTVRRGDKTLTVRLSPAKSSDGTVRIGALVRDSLAGIGTITFYDPVSGTFGALGHGICESETGVLMPIGSGSSVLRVSWSAASPSPIAAAAC